MKRFIVLFLFLFNTLTAFTVLAAPPPLPLQHKLDLNSFRGQTFLQAMTSSRNGVKATIDNDYAQTYKVADADTVAKAVDNFDTKVSNAVLGGFNGDRSALKDFIKSIEGTEFDPSTIVNVIKGSYKGSGNVFALANFIAMASGAGTLVKINDNNYYYNFGYASGDNANDVKTGRSYGASPGHNANDASDVMYLNEVEQYIKSTDNPSAFYKTFFEIMTECNTDGYADLSDLGQTVMTDLIAIYTAESDRHIMVNLDDNKHPWENDLAETTFMASYSAIEGKLMQNGVLQPGSMKLYWALGKSGTGSGIGVTRTDRRKLQVLMSQYLRKQNSQLTAKIDELTGGARSDGDLFHAVMSHLNTLNAQDDVKQNASSIVTDLVDLIMQVRNNGSDITSDIEG